MTYTEQYWKKVDARYSLPENRHLHDLLNNEFAYYSDELETEHESLSVEDQKTDNQLCIEIPKFRADCQEYDRMTEDDPRREAYKTDIPIKYREIMDLMTKRGWAKIE